MQLSHLYNWPFSPSRSECSDYTLIHFSSAGASATAHSWLHVGESHHKVKLSDLVHFYCLRVILGLARTVVSCHRLPLNAHPQAISSVQQWVSMLNMAFFPLKIIDSLLHLLFPNSSQYWAPEIKSINIMRAFRRSRHQCVSPRFQCQLRHVNPGHAFPLAMCIFMLPMLALAAEHVQLAATNHMNPMDQWCIHLHRTTFKHVPLMLPSLNYVLPAMALQNEIVKSNIWCLSYSSSHASVHHVSFSSGFIIPSGLGRMVVGAVVVLLLLMSGDIEMNPGPVGEYINMMY